MKIHNGHTQSHGPVGTRNCHATAIETLRSFVLSSSGVTETELVCIIHEIFTSCAILLCFGTLHTSLTNHHHQ